jgi:hypothetical protein
MVSTFIGRGFAGLTSLCRSVIVRNDLILPLSLICSTLSQTIQAGPSQ